MKILLVNSNPVVSRLTALSARKESVKLDEIKDISKLKKYDYDIVFVDFEAYSDELSNVLGNSHISKKVLFYTQDDRDKPELFNLSILKPFLPSEVSAVLREAKIEIEEKSEKEEEEEFLNFDDLIADKENDLKPINIVKEEIELEPLNFIEDDVFEKKEPKAKVEKKLEIEDIELEQINLMDDKTSEEKLLSELKKSENRLKNIEKTPPLPIKELVVDEVKEESKLFELDVDDKKKESDTNSRLFESDNLDNSDESKDEILDFDVSSKEEVDFDAITEVSTPKKDETVKKEEAIKEEESTKILDKDEISNIQSLLNNDLDEDITLDEVMTTTAPQPTKKEKKPKKRKRSKRFNKLAKESGSKVILDSLGSLPVDDLRRLLLGSEVHITIKFPKE